MDQYKVALIPQCLKLFFTLVGNNPLENLDIYKKTLELGVITTLCSLINPHPGNLLPLKSTVNTVKA
jgi:hypothetical protein